MLLNRKRTWQQILLFLVSYIIPLCGLIVLLLYDYFTMYGQMRNSIYSSDALYLPSLYNDMVTGNSILTWNFPPSSYLFPDMLLYFAASVITPNLHCAVVVYAIIQFLLFIVGMCLLANQALPHIHPSVNYLIIIFVASCFLLLLPNLEHFSQTIFVSAHHFGIVLVLPYVLAIIYHQMRSDKINRWLIAALCGLSFITCASDGLFLVQVTAPVILSLAILFLTKHHPLRRTLIIAGGLLFSSLLGQAVTSIYVWSHPKLREYLFQPSAISSSFAHLLRDIPTLPIFHIVLILLLLACCAFVIAKFMFRFFRRKEQQTNNFVLFPLYFFSAFFINILAIISAGLFVDRNAFRYFLPTFIFSGFFGFPLLLSASNRINSPLFRAGMIGAVTFAGIFAISQSDFQKLRMDAYYPPAIQCLDENAARLGLQFGVANYWQARPITMLSQTGLQVTQVNRNLSPYYWINNIAWYNIQPQFAIIDISLPDNHRLRLDETHITKRFGKPDATFQCESYKILVYAQAKRKFDNLFDNVIPSIQK